MWLFFMLDTFWNDSVGGGLFVVLYYIIFIALLYHSTFTVAIAITH